MSNQISIFDLLADEMLEKSTTKSICSNYLFKEERILSLLKEKELKTKDFKAVTFFDSISINTYRKKHSDLEKIKYLMSRFKASVTDKAIDECDLSLSELDGKIVTSNISPIKDLFYGFGDLEITREPEATNEAMVYFSFGKSYSERTDIKVFRFKLKNSNVDYALEKDLFFCEISKKTVIKSSQVGRGYKLRNKRMKDYVTVIDLSYFTRAWMLFYLRDKVQEKIVNKSLEELESNKIYKKMKEKQDKLIKNSLSNDVLYIYEKCIHTSYITAYLESNNISYKVFNPNTFTRIRGRVLDIADFSYAFMLAPSLLKNDFAFSSCLVSNNRRDCGRYVSNSALINTFELFIEEYTEDKIEFEYSKKLSSTYAKVYQTKKNIPDTHISAMENSKFNEYFGYVEFDEDCDLEKIAEIEKEFLALASYLKFKPRENVQIRFRKLGKHKAAGLYYPSLKCVCIDVRYPDSLMHEMFHMLDYEDNKLSRSYDFDYIKTLYIKAFDKGVANAGEDVKKEIASNNKYNRDYYTQATEIFARCGEMYLTRHKKINNSLVKPDENLSFAYPEDINLLDAIICYFDNLFGFKKDEIIKVAASY